MGLRLAVAGATGVVGHLVVEEARVRGHDVIALSRKRGVDLLGDGLGAALEGADAIIDASGPDSTERAPATEFFEAAGERLQLAGKRAGVRHLVVLSITGIDRVPFGYYAAKLAQERLATEGPLPATILRASPFHEFAAQMISWTRKGLRAPVLDLRLQSVAARSAAGFAVDLAEGEPVGRAPDLAGPEAADLVDLARALVARRGERLEIESDTDGLEGMARDVFLPAEGARLVGPTFGQWLDGDDASSISLSF